MGLPVELTTSIETVTDELTSEEGEQEVPYLVVQFTMMDDEVIEILQEYFQEHYLLNNNHQPYLSEYIIERNGIYSEEQNVILKFPLKEKYYTGNTYNPEIIEDVTDEP